MSKHILILIGTICWSILTMEQDAIIAQSKMIKVKLYFFVFMLHLYHKGRWSSPVVGHGYIITLSY